MLYSPKRQSFTQEILLKLFILILKSTAIHSTPSLNFHKKQHDFGIKLTKTDNHDMIITLKLNVTFCGNEQNSRK